MPTNRRHRVHGRRPVVDETQWAYLTDQPAPEGHNPFAWLMLGNHWAARGANNHPTTRELWNDCREDVLAEWITDKPGTRPRLWWEYDAPRWTSYDPDRWAGYHALPNLCEPRLRLGGVGTPCYEVWNYAPHHPLGIPERHLDCDPAFPPLYEAQAAHLKRLGLLAPGELQRLTADDFKAAPIVPDENELAGYWDEV